MIEWKNANSPFYELMSLAEAAEIWGKEPSTLRRAIMDGRLEPGVDCWKYGKQWVITAVAMHRFTGDWGPWSDYLVEQRKKQKGDL